MDGAITISLSKKFLGLLARLALFFETDAVGDFIGSSFLYATAQDWAKLGQLYLQNGAWNETRILPEDWAAFVSSPASQSDRQYGGQFWLNLEGEEGRNRFMPGLPENAYMMSGHEGQYVIILPETNVVIVRLGRTPGNPMAVVNPVLSDIYATLTD